MRFGDIVDLADGQYIEKPDSVCRNCGERISWWPMSHFWNHGSGPTAGLIHCFEKPITPLPIPHDMEFSDDRIAAPPETV